MGNVDVPRLVYSVDAVRLAMMHKQIRIYGVSARKLYWWTPECGQESLGTAGLEGGGYRQDREIGAVKGVPLGLLELRGASG